VAAVEQEVSVAVLSTPGAARPIPGAARPIPAAVDRLAPVYVINKCDK